MNHNQTVGQYGEELARKYLRDRGYEIIESNVKTSYKELDIVARKKDLLVFVEVKTRTSKAFGSADESMTDKKIRNLKQAVSMYLARRKIKFGNLRVDLIAVDIDRYTNKANVSYYSDII